MHKHEFVFSNEGYAVCEYPGCRYRFSLKEVKEILYNIANGEAAQPDAYLNKGITYSQKYAPAMKITDKQQAIEYFEACVVHTMSFGKSRKEAEEIERKNINYYAGYYDDATIERVKNLFDENHLK